MGAVKELGDTPLPATGERACQEIAGGALGVGDGTQAGGQI